MPISTQRPRSLPIVCLAISICCAFSCSSTGENTQPDPATDETFRPLGPASRSDDSIGKYMADLSTSINAWMEKTLTASTGKERKKQSILETNIGERVCIRQAEIVEELETGSVKNRIIAAAALGFCGDPAVLSPLLTALDDPEEKVVGNALMGLGLLNSPGTPLHPIGELLRYSANPRTRWSAADCALSLIAGGADQSGIVEAARAGLTDAQEPMVRTQCALILALIGDTESIDALAVLLYDEYPLVSKSAAQSLAYIGTRQDKSAGAAARALVAALAEGDRDLRLRVHPSLARLSGRDYGLDVEEWQSWADKLP